MIMGHIVKYKYSRRILILYSAFFVDMIYVYLSVPRPIGPVKSTAGVQVNWGNPPHLKKVVKVYWTVKRPSNSKTQLLIDFELCVFSPFIQYSFDARVLRECV